MKYVLIGGAAALCAALFCLAPATTSAQGYPTPTTQSSYGNATITGTPTDPTLTVNGDGEAEVWYGVNVDLCGGGTSACYIPLYPNTFSVFTVPLLLTYSVTASATGSTNGQAIGEFAIYDVSEQPGFDVYYNCSYDGGSCGTTKGIQEHYDYEYGFCGNTCFSQPTAYVHMYAYASGGAYAQVDPTFTIAPDFLQAYPNATLTVSPVAISAAPEPRAWLLMMLGVGAMGAALRFRRRGSFGDTKPNSRLRARACAIEVQIDPIVSL